MKRILLAIMAVVMLFSFVGCADNTGDATSSNKKPTSSLDDASADGSSSAGDTSGGDPSVGASSENGSTGTPSTPSEQGNSKVALSVKDGETFTLVPQGVVDYVKAAENYDLNDFTTSIVADYLSAGFKAVPVTLSWSYSDGYKPSEVKVLVSESKDMKNAVEHKVDSGKTKIEIYNLKTNATYYWCVKADSKNSASRSFKTADTPRIMYLPGVTNVRDIGGWKDANGRAMNQGLVYRGKALGSLTAEGVTMAKALGIKTVLDLRKDTEYTASDYVDGVGKLGKDVNVVKIAASGYSSYMSANSAKKQLKLFADYANYPIYFHCTAGADRTGTQAYVLEALCGVQDKYLIMDYELTVVRPRTYGEFPDFVKNTRKLSGATTQEKFYNRIRKTFGLTDMELSNIYNILMTESAVFDSNSLAACRKENGAFCFDLVLRNSGGVASVSVNGKNATWTMKGNTLAITTNELMGSGVITLKDGATLNFTIG